jgi:hypothetical protein
VVKFRVGGRVQGRYSAREPRVKASSRKLAAASIGGPCKYQIFRIAICMMFPTSYDARNCLSKVDGFFRPGVSLTMAD